MSGEPDEGFIPADIDRLFDEEPYSECDDDGAYDFGCDWADDD